MRALLFLCLLVSLSSVVCAAIRLPGRVRSSSTSLDPFNPADYDMRMTNEERAYRAANQPGGEISFCCCYCGRGGLESSSDSEGSNATTTSDGVPSEDAWLYAPLPNQPRAEAGDPVDRLARRRHPGRLARGVHLDAPYGDAGTPGIAQFILFRTVQSHCTNEYCIDQSPVCLRSHLWTGWAGALTFSSVHPPTSKVRDRCQSVYQREMEVLDDFNHMLDKDQAERG